jgi:hypothetical protein
MDLTYGYGVRATAIMAIAIVMTLSNSDEKNIKFAQTIYSDPRYNYLFTDYDYSIVEIFYLIILLHLN